MAWQNLPGLGSNQNSGSNGGGDVQPAPSQPQATEYTLQGVMRFLQTEWHRHERDRNSWEIERQEMKGRIAKLEGSTRKSNAGNRALKKYVDILETALKERDKLVKELKAGKDIPDSIRVKKENATRLFKERSERSNKQQKTFLCKEDTVGSIDEDPERSNLKSFMDKTQAEIIYLMLSPSNPLPPRDPNEELSSHIYETNPNQQESEHIYQQASRQKMIYSGLNRLSPITSHHPPSISASQNIKNKDRFNPIVNEHSTPNSSAQDWPPSYESQNSNGEERVTKINHTFDQYGRETTYEEEKSQFGANGWDFNEVDTIPEAEAKPLRPDTDLFPIAQDLLNSSNRYSTNRRKRSVPRRKCPEQDQPPKIEGPDFKVRFGLRGHLDVVRSVIFTGGGSPSEPEICTTGDDGTIKRWIIPARLEGQGTSNSDMDIQSSFTHRGHTGSVMCLTSWSPSQNISGGGRAQGDGWIFSGGQDATIRVWEQGRVDPKATIDGHTDAVWTVCILPGTTGSVLGNNSNLYGGPDQLLLASGSADGTIKVWSVNAPPQSLAAKLGSRRGSRVRGNSMSSGSGFSLSPQPSVGSNTPFCYSLIHSLSRINNLASPTCITTLSFSETAFVASYMDAAVIVYDTKSGDEIAAMASLEAYDNTPTSGVNTIVASSSRSNGSPTYNINCTLSEDESVVNGSTGRSRSDLEGIIISGHEDRYIRFYDANSGQCTYSMLAHPAAIAALALSPDGKELVSAGHDASLRFWSLEKRSCTQEITSHRLMKGEGVCSVAWSRDGRWVVSAGGDGVVKVFAR
ncbi:Striatin Pro11 [Erysiphe neolycopersici]|uniref:Striatin Pro11 n=1 Tax=Erysiphe neolycopersici TaxID=212602 RepID=A0A420HXT0_9PEZI|nr:Striatin Pro11 [Erysiphe neolycopersici]